MSRQRGALIIDPQPHMAGLVAAMLRTIGRTGIREANDGATALTELGKQAFDVVIIDDAITGPAALDIVRSLRANADSLNHQTPIIMTAAAPDAASIAAARDAGVTEFLRKPFAAVHLQARLDSIETSPRAFVDSPAYTGPDRRRRVIEPPKGERRSDDKT
jgi:two-component system chemotaxis response regulator CheY